MGEPNTGVTESEMTKHKAGVIRKMEDTFNSIFSQWLLTVKPLARKVKKGNEGENKHEE